ncbi:MAG: amidohydrolase family protein [Planctomycetota bacterium]|nr:amidohydrolase family protein [Planctomycetota bacterium]
MSVQFLTNARMVLPGERVLTGNLLLSDGKIAAFDPASVPAGASTLDCEGRWLTPGLIDLHTHGIDRHFYHWEQSPEAFAAALRVLPKYGTTCVVPTIVPPTKAALLEPLARLFEMLPHDGAVVPGFHLEVPFVALGGAACPTLPGDLGLLEDLIAACGRRVSIMSLSPEQQGIIPVIQRLREQNILPFITHTRASVEQTEAAMEAGARHATHFYDVFPVPEETDAGARPVGAVEAILADPRASVDFICDGVHVHPTAIRAAVAAKGWEKVMLITDSNIGAGLPSGEYDTPWGYRVRVAPGDGARHATQGFLAGSALTMDLGMKNLLRWLASALTPEQIWAMGTLNPARLLGLTNKGRIAPGADADLVLWDEQLNVVKTWVGGQCVFTRDETL